MKYKYSYLLLVFFCCFTVRSVAQDSLVKETINARLSASYIIGAQVYNDNVLYNPGYTFSIAAYKPHSPYLNYGIGSSMFILQTERFIPFYVDIISYKNEKSNSNFIQAQCGYSHAWSKHRTLMPNYTLKGGVYISIGTGRKVAISNTVSLLLHWAYVHQFATMKYTVFGDNSYTETLNYDMFSLSISILSM
ncbi:MAG: hypothetical protein M0R02_01850 [Bacteroidales bacterium]|jgi:hypothetical protein|nr:hypothetical protein [Bacteroidales bacterium]NLK81531.1 hypothetical protein [Bacteroidales bacterium]